MSHVVTQFFGRDDKLLSVNFEKKEKEKEKLLQVSKVFDRSRASIPIPNRWLPLRARHVLLVSRS